MSAKRGFPGGTVTFLFTDVEGSTQLLKQLGREQYRRALEDHQRLVREACAPAGAREVDTQGDAFFFVFAKAHDAVDAAAEAQRKLAGHSWPDETSLRIRMGIHTGEALQADGRYVGLSVHRAARVCGVAHGGQVLLSETTARVLEDEELGELSVRPVGRYELKDFDRPVELQQLDIPGLPTAFARPKPKAPRRVPWRRRHVLAGGGVVVAAALVAALVVVLTAAVGGGAGALTGVEANSIGAIDPDRDEIVGQVRVGTQPTQLAVGDDAVWVSNAADRTISRTEPATLEVVRTLPIGGDRVGLAAAGSELWVADYNIVQPHLESTGTPRRVRTTLSRVELPSYTVSSIPVSDAGALDWFLSAGTAPVAASAKAAWVATNEGLAQVGLDGSVKKRYPLQGRPDMIMVDDGAAWVLRKVGTSPDSGNRLQRIDLRSGILSDELVVPGDVAGIAVGENGVWIAVRDQNSVVRVDPATNTVVDTIPVGQGPIGVAAGEGGVWVANDLSRSVSRIDPKTNDVVATIPLGNRPAGIAVGHGRVWVSVF